MSLMYSQMPLDRCTNQRKNLAWLKKEFNRSNTLFCLIHNGNNFLSSEQAPSALYLTAQQLPQLSINSCVFLGQYSDKSHDQPQAVFALDSNKLSFTQLEQLNTLGQWHSLREVTSLLNATDAAILALAKGLIHWHKSHLYCGKCGTVNQLVEAGHARQCTHSDCRNLSFPRTDPAVIMLVERMFEDGIARCLLGRQASWPEQMYSTLAGFVDPGETLEEAVIREVAEESGIQTHQVQYIASQPWPFPASIMLGFTAVALTQEIDITHDDLEMAQWFSRDELAQFSEKDSDSTGYKMSSRDSISYHLINAWKNHEIGTL